MIINSRASNFVLTFPKGFFTDFIECKYLPYVKRLPLPYDTVTNLMASTIQSVNFPSLTMDPVSQTRLYGKKQEFKNSTPIADLFTKDLTVTFKTLDGYINYWIFLENALQYLAFDNREQYTDDLQLRFLSQEGHVITTTVFKGIYFKGLSEIILSYSDNNPEFKTFDASFGFFKMDVLIEKD